MRLPDAWRVLAYTEGHMSESGLLSLGTIDILVFGWIAFAGGGCPVHCMIFRSSPGLYSRGQWQPSLPPPRVVILTISVYRHCQMALVENNCSER